MNIKKNNYFTKEIARRTGIIYPPKTNNRIIIYNNKKIDKSNTSHTIIIERKELVVFHDERSFFICFVVKSIHTQ